MHPTSKRFHELVEELLILHDTKALDYGVDEDPLRNVRNSQDFGVEPWIGCMIRANDKMKRIQTFAQKGTLANESIYDSLRDLAVYSIIGIVLLEETDESKRVSTLGFSDRDIHSSSETIR